MFPVVDAGSSGALTFGAFRDLLIKKARCRTLAFLNISMIGNACSGITSADAAPKGGELQRWVSN